MSSSTLVNVNDIVNLDGNKLLLPNGQLIERPWFIPDEQSLREQHKILTSIYYLVKQGDVFGERLPCTRCQRRHDYITLMCINKPFNGMFSGLYAYYRLVKDNRIQNYLNPAARARYQDIVKMFGSMPDLSTLHPETASKMMADLGLNDQKIGGLSLGVLEGISRKEAFKLQDNINITGLKPRYLLGEPTRYDLYKAIDYTRKRNNGAKIHWTR